tara:strand:- start:253 stop:507 length:255 start_codon:yes stop_codon:yes gene_type:complete
MAVGDVISIFRSIGFQPAAGVEIVLTSFHNAGLGANIGIQDGVNNSIIYQSNGFTAASCKMGITNTIYFFANNIALSATGIQTK